MTKIEWAEKTANFLTGCTRVSEGCRNCYAEKMSKRLKAMGQEKYQDAVDPQTGLWTRRVQFDPKAADTILATRKPTRWFINSMSDTFHEDVPDEWIDQIFAAFSLSPQHTFLVLTKRAQRMRDYFGQDRMGFIEHHAKRRNPMPGMTLAGTWPWPNVWLGVSVENQAAANERIPLLLQTPAAVRFLSCEPLLGPVDLSNTFPDITGRLNAFTGEAEHLLGMKEKTLGVINWVICGGESGPGARPMRLEWARSLRDQCQAAGVPFFFKQWGEYLPTDQATPEQISSLSFGKWLETDLEFVKVGKSKAGRLLDGRTWDEFPEVSKRPKSTTRGRRQTVAKKFTKGEVLGMAQYPITTENFDEAVALVIEAHTMAIKKHPQWPVSIYAGDAIITEELGEAAKAAIDAKFAGHPLADLLAEHAQAGAMHIRQLQHLLNVEEDPEEGV